ncbi:MFS transporter [Alphaproteobacteria bacterium]|nr:MFS transporter [Alphaproteobacteria bacterium]
MTTAVDPTRAQKVLRYRWVCLCALWLVYFFVYFDRVAPAVVAPEMMREFGITASAMGLLSAAYFYPYAAMQIPSGILSDFLGPRMAVTIFFIIAGIGTAMFGFASTYDVAILGRVCMGIGVAVVYIPIMKIQAQWFRPREFATLTGILLTVGNVGALGAAAPLALFVGIAGWRETFFWLGGVSVLLAIMVFIFVRNRPQDMGLPTLNEVDGIVVDEATQAADDALTFKEILKMAFTNWNFWWLAVYAFAVYGPMMGFQGLWAIPYMQDVMGFTKQQASNVVSFWAIGMIVGCPLSGLLSDRIMKARKLTTIIGASIYVLGWVVIYLYPSGWSQTGLSLFCFLMGGFGGFYIINYPHVSENLPRKAVGTAIGVFNMWYFVGGALYQQFMGKILDSTGRSPIVRDGVSILDASGNPLMGFPAEAYANTFLLCLIGMIFGLAALFFTRETYGTAPGGPTNILGREMKK